MTSSTSFVLTHSTDKQKTFTAMNPKAEISEFDIRPSDKTMTLLCNQPVITSACVLYPGLNILTNNDSIHTVIGYLMENHKFFEEHATSLRKSF
ncbi:MAG: hypothetical protein ACK4HV_07655 [Parachlamydiaceae bacterium]